MPADGSPDTPMAVILPETASDEPAPAVAAEPQRRRVRRKTAASTVGTDDAADAAAEEVAPPLEPEIAFVEAEAEPAPVAPEPEPEPEIEPTPVAAETLVVAEEVAPPAPEADLSAIIANDPNQITAPPAKPKRGWWRL